MASDVDLIINVATQGVEKLTDLSASLRQVQNTIQGISVPMTKLDVHTRAVNKAFGITSRGARDHAKSLKEVIRNQSALSQESKRIKNDIVALNSVLKLSRNSSALFKGALKETSVELTHMSRNMRNMRLRAFVSDLQNVSLKMQRIGKDTQFVGRNMLINLTAPILLFARVGFQSLVRIDEQMVRLTKVLDNVAMNAEQAQAKLGGFGTEAQVQELVNNFNLLNKELTDISSTYGVAKDLVIGLASDFAELGLTARESITRMTELTTAVEKLGNMDMGAAQDLTQALYFQSRRALENTGALAKLTTAREREIATINAATTQMYMFNAIENTTALTLRDLGEAFPEVASMAISYGLSMTEAAALLAPMKSAGLDVGASANSIKVSLQRALSPTKQNRDLLQKLAQQYGVTADQANIFDETTKTGLVGLNAIVEVFGKVKDSAAGTEGALQLMSDLFEKRQGPRMFLAIEQLNLFNKTLRNVAAGTAERRLADAAENIAQSFTQLTDDQLPKTITSFKDIGIIARLATATVGQEIQGVTGKITQAQIDAAKAVRKGVADEILAASRDGEDLLAEVQTEAGRALFIQLAGAENAQAVAQRELETALSALGVTVQKIKNDFKLFAAEILQRMTPAIKRLQEIVASLYERWSSLSEETRDRISKLIFAVGAAAAALGPLTLGFGLVQQVAGTLGRVLLSIFPKLKNLEGGFIGLASSAGFAKKSINDFYTNLLDRKKRNAESLIAEAMNTGGGRLPMQPRFADQDEGRRVFTNARRMALRGAVPGATGAEIREATRLAAQGVTAPSTGLARGARGRFLSRNVTDLLRAMPAASQQALTEQTMFERRASQMVRRQPFLQRAGILTDRMGTQFFRGGREITETQATRLARGGIGGRFAAAQISGAAARERVTGIATAPLRAYNRSVIGAKDAVAALAAKNAAFGAAAPGFFARASAAVGGFTKATKIGTGAIKLMKIALVSSGIGVILLGVAGAAVFVIKNFEKIREKSEYAFGRIGATIQTLKETFTELIRPIVDMFASIGGGAAGSEGAINGIARAFGMLANAISFVAVYIKKFVVNVIQPYLYGIINIVMAVVAIFKGEWGKAGQFLIAAFSNIGKAIINFFKVFAIGAIKIVQGLVQKILDTFGKIPFIGAMFRGVSGLVGTIGDAAIFGITKIADGITSQLEKGTKLGIKKSQGELLKSKPNWVKPAAQLGAATGEAISNSMGEGIEDGAEKAGQKLKDAVKDLAQKLQDYVANALKQALDTFVDKSVKALNKQKEAALKIFDTQLKTLDKLEKAEESLTRTKEYETNRRKMIDERAMNALNYVRNRALAIYEGRIDDARMLDLEEVRNRADFQQELGSLEESRRKDLAKENLDALKEAIAEARTTANQFFDESIEKFQESIKEITKFPPVTLEDYKNQLEQIRVATNEAADKNNEEFGAMFEEFTSTINDKMPNKVIGAFTTNLDELVTVAKDKYGLGGTPEENSVIGVTIGMLADIGGKFSSNAPTILASFGQITGGIKSNFASMKDSLLSAVKNEFLDPFKKALDDADPTAVFEQAIKDGNQAILDSFRGTVGGVGSEVDNMLDLLTQRNKDLARLQAEAADIMSKMPGGAGAGGVGPGMPTPVMPANFTTADRYEEALIRAGKLPARVGTSTFTTGRARIIQRKTGGFVPGPVNMPVPAMLHGGEYVLNASAVNRIGLSTLRSINSARFTPPSRNVNTAYGQSQSATTVNIAVDTFIGEEEWFRSMMKSYNVNVAPKNQKLAGNEQRILSSYSGINQVM